MTTSSPSPDAENTDQASPHPAFAGLGVGLHFFQDWMKAASSAGLGTSPMGASTGQAQTWGLPTLDPEALEKRIEELRTVQFWLEQNSRMIAMTIQGMEVQRMTLQTLRDMNVSMDAVRDSLRAQTEEAAAAAAGPTATAPPEDEATPAGAAINPLRWWGTLTDQFQTLAQQAVQQVASTAQAASEAAATSAADATATSNQRSTARPDSASSASRARPRKSAAHTPSPDRPARAPRPPKPD